MSLTCERPPCPEHNHCAFHGTEDGRCPWCHAEWRTLIVRGSHTCEQAKAWPSQERKSRIAHAVQLRTEAHQRLYAVDGQPHCPHAEFGAI